MCNKYIKNVPQTTAVVAERLRRLTRNQIPSGSVGSNPTNCGDFLHFCSFFCFWVTFKLTVLYCVRIFFILRFILGRGTFNSIKLAGRQQTLGSKHLFIIITCYSVDGILFSSLYSLVLGRWRLEKYSLKVFMGIELYELPKSKWNLG